MKVLLDTNILLDVLLVREPHFEDSKAILTLVATESIQGYVTANSVLDTYYVARKNMTEIEACTAMRNLMDLVAIIAVEGRDCERALLLDHCDFEDAVLLCCGERAEMDVIVTRDAELQSTWHETLKVMTPGALQNLCTPSF